MQRRKGRRKTGQGHLCYWNVKDGVKVDRVKDMSFLFILGIHSADTIDSALTPRLRKPIGWLKVNAGAEDSGSEPLNSSESKARTRYQMARPGGIIVDREILKKS
jgi:hypothetical protein